MIFRISFLLLTPLLAFAGDGESKCESMLRLGAYRTDARELADYGEFFPGTGVKLDLWNFKYDQDLDGARKIVELLKDIFERHPYLKNGNVFHSIYARNHFSALEGNVFIDVRASDKIEAFLVSQATDRVWEKQNALKSRFDELHEVFFDRHQVKLHGFPFLYNASWNEIESFVQRLSEVLIRKPKLADSVGDIFINKSFAFSEIDPYYQRLTPKVTIKFNAGLKEMSDFLEQNSKSAYELEKNRNSFKYASDFFDTKGISLVPIRYPSFSHYATMARLALDLVKLYELDSNLFVRIRKIGISEYTFVEPLNANKTILSISVHLDQDVAQYIIESTKKAENKESAFDKRLDTEFFEITGIHFKTEFSEKQDSQKQKMIDRLVALYKKEPDLFKNLKEIEQKSTFTYWSERHQYICMNPLFDWSLKRNLKRYQKDYKKHLAEEKKKRVLQVVLKKTTEKPVKKPSAADVHREINDLQNHFKQGDRE